LNFFANREHAVIASDSLVPTNDSSLLFTGAGMNQFKDHFLGRTRLNHPRQRAVSSQKCIRTGDIENVGRTPNHHTFFEMLGNFSFGDYFKAEATAWAWEFLTGPEPEGLGLDKNRLSVTIFGGDEKLGIACDEEAAEAWKRTAPELRNSDGSWRIYGCGEHDNFWPADAPSQGPNGPCGPCSEIYYDLTPGAGAPCSPAADGERYTELWNLVFTQFDRRDDGLKPLPQRNIDTGAGLERIARILQGKQTNFDIDLLIPIVAKVAEISGKRYGDAPDDDRRLRRITDHIRAGVFCIADGVTPKNEGRNYVVRRLLRRALLDGRKLGIEDLFLAQVAGVVIAQMKVGYPELAPRMETLAKLIEEEERAFSRTLRQGETHFAAAAEEAKAKGAKMLSGAVVFRLWDTFGFPLEVTAEHAHEAGLSIDEEGWTREMELARERSREGGGFSKEIFSGGPLAELKTQFSGKPTAFVGYDVEQISGAKVLALIADQTSVESAESGKVTVLLDRTPFYGESGGQIGDEGVMQDGGGTTHRVLASKRLDDLILHEVELAGPLAVGAEVTAAVGAERRAAIRRNHSATHLLHMALRTVLGAHVEQRGSLVAADRLRFDFTHFAQPTATELAKIEALVNKQIAADMPVETRITSPAEARAAGAMALFGEKYGDKVRLVAMGPSKELCGGTHVGRTGQVNYFRLVGESAIAAGVRRLEALTGPAAVADARGADERLTATARMLKTTPAELEARAAALLEERQALAREITQLKRKLAQGSLDDFLAKAKTVAGVTLVTALMEGADAKAIRDAADELRRKAPEAALVLGGSAEGKAALLISFSPALVARGAHAGKMIKELAAMVGGGGGGKPDAAQAGGKNPEKLPEAINAAEALLAKML
jgi:alanyl-tRNA synthetase